MARRTLWVWWALTAVACGHRAPATLADPAAPGGASPDPGAEVQALDQALDAVEERLLVGQARVRFWQEMRERHESVSAVAAVNLERHIEDMAGLDHRQRDRSQVTASARRNRVAARMMPTAQATR